jgi:hypothetical protein
MTLVVHTERSRCLGPLLGVPPSFMLSVVPPGMYIAAQAIVEYIPVMPSMSLNTEFPLSFVDGFTRAMLLCSLIPPAVVTHTSPVIASSPWTLLLTSLVCHAYYSHLHISNITTGHRQWWFLYNEHVLLP